MWWSTAADWVERRKTRCSPCRNLMNRRKVLDQFEKSALDSLRNNPDQKIVDTATSLFSDKVRLIAPVVMGPACVSCHNVHPESPKTDWKVGDVRGIQEVTITQPIAANLFSFKYLLAYLWWLRSAA
jgi:adenylate cyclase